MPPKESIRVRIAPSPTGYFHFGTARTALFNWLFAKKLGGKFIVRIEDTDKSRSKKEYEENILKSLAWLGLTWDEGPSLDGKKYIGNYGPYRQSERIETYEKYLKELLEKNEAYYCFCKNEDLEAQKESQKAEGMAPKYLGHCRNLTSKEIDANLKAKKPSVIRIKIPEIKITFNDLIRGKVSTDMNLLGDQVIAKSLSEPLYNFAVVVDDYLMKISHVIRAEDHIANTPKQIVIQKALNFNEVIYAHLPLILNPDRSKMSKRFLDVSISDYEKDGYLPEAMVNFMALIGWHPKTERGEKEKEVFSLTELIKEFEIERVQKGGGIFNEEKLDWINNQYIKNIDSKIILEKLKSKNLIPENQNLNEASVLKIIDLNKDRLKKLADFKSSSDFFFKIPNYDKNLLVWKKSTLIHAIICLQECLKVLNDLDEKEFVKSKLEMALFSSLEKLGKGEVLWPLRVALSGKEFSPPPYEIIEILGKSESIKRIKDAIDKLEK